MRGREGPWGIFWVMKTLSSWVAVTQMYQLSELISWDTEKVCASDTVTPGNTETQQESMQAGHTVSRTVRSDFLAIKNSQSMAENSSCLLFAKSMPIKAAEQTPPQDLLSFPFDLLP